MFTTHLEVHGTRIFIESYDASVKSHLDHDFSYFLAEAGDGELNDHFHVRVLPRQKKSANWIPWLKTKRSTLYAPRHGCRRVCFFQSAWLEYSVKKNRCTVFSDVPAASYESVYFVLLSYLGEKLGVEGMHRVHGMGFRYKDQGVILLAPSGGGKSTLAMELLKDEDFGLISDDTPVVNAHGKMLAFPQRIALEKKPEILPKFYRRFKRFGYHEKFVIGADYFRDKILDSSEIKWLMLLDPNATEQGVREVSRLKALWPIVKWLVLGLETPQIWELFLRSGRYDLRNQAGILLGRLKTATRLVAKARVAVLKRGKTPKETIAQLGFFLNQTAAPAEGAPTKN